MKIINYGKHDYYDSAMAYLSEPDKSCIYDRKVREVWLNLKKDISLSRKVEIRVSKNISAVKSYILIFCGKTYPFIKIDFKDIDKNPEYAYSFEEYKKILNNYNLDLLNKKAYFYYADNIRFDKGAKEFFNQKNKDFSELMHKYSCPSILIEYSYGMNDGDSRSNWQNKITLNPNLKNIKFMKVISPTEAFQEIYMYLGGVLSNNNDPSENISDEIKRNQKGFNEFSFKAMKGDKKPRKKNRNKEK